MDSEPELERAYADLTMIVRPDMRHYDTYDVLIEFKVVLLKEAGLHAEQALAASEDELRSLPAVSQAFAEAEAQQQIYIPRLQKKIQRSDEIIHFCCGGGRV